MELKKKKEPWRIAIGIIAVSFIVFLWIKKDVFSFYSTLPAVQVTPLIVTTVVVSLLKAGAVAGALLFVKWLIGKIKKKNAK